MHQPVDDKLIEKIQTKVLNRLGKPPGLMSVHCVNVFDNNWRINVWTKGFTDGGVPTHEIMAQSGHKTTQMIDRYTKLSNIRETSAAKKI